MTAKTASFWNENMVPIVECQVNPASGVTARLSLALWRSLAVASGWTWSRSASIDAMSHDTAIINKASPAISRAFGGGQLLSRR